MSSTRHDPDARPRMLSAAWWIRDRDGRVVLAQAPNPAIVLWFATVVLGWTNLLDDRHEEVVTWVGRGALLAWALDELVRGASPARRALGAVVTAAMLVRVFG